MNIQAEHPNFLQKPMFQNFKFPEYFPNKLKAIVNEHKSEAFSHSKENVVKISNLKHEFRTPSIVNTHKLPKAFNNNYLNTKIENEKSHDENKASDQNKDTKTKFEEIDIKKNIFLADKKSHVSNLKVLQKSEKNEIKLDKIEQKAFKLNKNPIIPLKNFFKIVKQNENELFQESPTVKLLCSKLDIGKVSWEEKPQISEMVMISSLSSDTSSNQVKVMLHVPTLKTFAIRVF